MKIFITGSEGFVGQHAVKLLQQDNNIIGLSRELKLKPEHNTEYFVGDILNKSFIYNFLKEHKPEVILHLAGIAKTWSNDPKEVFDINLYGTLVIYEAVVKLKSEGDYNPKIVYISSADVYGKTDNPNAVAEDSHLNPINTYGVSKAAADRLSYQYSQTYNLNIVILRPFPHIGPGQGLGFFVSDVASQIAKIENDSTRDVLEIGNLESIRDYLDVRDVVQAYKNIIDLNYQPGDVFNICSGKGIKMKDILNQLLELSNKKIVVKQNPAKLRVIDLPVFIGDNQKIKAATKWEPVYSLKQSLQDILEFWRGRENA